MRPRINPLRIVNRDKFSEIRGENCDSEGNSRCFSFNVYSFI